MAGRNQHHIPQSVLKGFARDPEENPQRVWEYRRGAPVAPRPTYEVAAQRDFYSKPGAEGEETLDDKITDYERDRFTHLLRRLREAPAGSAVAHDDAAEYLGHLIPRGDHMRRIFGETITRFLGDAKAFMADPDNIRAHLGLDDLEPGGVALDELRKLIATSGLSPFLAMAQISERSVERLGFAVLREYAGQAFAEAAAKASEELAAMSFDVKARVRLAHTDALERIGAAHRMPKLEHMTFTVEESKAELLLPDCVAIAIDAAGKAGPFTMLKREETVLVLAPFTPHSMLVGRAAPAATLPDEGELASMLASSAHTFFVAASDNFRELHERLGEVSGAEVERIITGVFERPRKAVAAEVEQTPQDRSFKLNTPEGFTEAETNELGLFIADVAKDVHATMALECLEAVTVTPSGTMKDCGTFLADHGVMEGDVHEGKLRLWVYLPRAVGEALVRESSEENFRQALLLLISALTRVAAASRLNALSSAYFRELGSDINAIIHQRGVVGALPAYVALAALRPAGETPKLDQQLDQAASRALDKADERLGEAKTKFEADNNADTFARAASECVMMITSAAAAIAGRADGALDAFPAFATALDARGFRAWFDRFDRDLEAFWDEPGSVQDPLSWGIHSERLMVRWGVVTWPLEKGRFMVRVFPEAFVEAADNAMKALADRMKGAPPQP